MRWSLFSAVLFIAIGAIPLGLLNVAGRLPLDGPTEPQSIKASFAATLGEPNVAIGASVTRAIDFEAMCIPGVSFVRNGQDIFETRALVEMLFARSSPDLIILPLIPGSQASPNDVGRPDRVQRRRDTYRFLHDEGQWDLIDGDWRQALLAQLTPATDSVLRYRRVYAFKRLFMGLPARPDSSEPENTSLDPAAAEEDALAKAQGRREQRDELLERDPDVVRRAEAMLQLVLKQASANGSKVAIVVPPASRPMLSKVTELVPEERAEFEEIMQQLESNGAYVFNYWADPRFADRIDLFRDGWHLNQTGGRMFSRILADDMQSRGLIAEPDCE